MTVWRGRPSPPIGFERAQGQAHQQHEYKVKSHEYDDHDS